MMLSRAAEHGLRLALQLAVGEGRGAYVPTRSLAAACDIPASYVGKICHRLTRAGILDSQKGPNGGVSLAREPAALTLLEIVEALDGLQGFDRCFLGLSRCGEQNPCPVHSRWKRIKQDILDMLSRRTIAELAVDVAAGRTTVVLAARDVAGRR